MTTSLAWVVVVIGLTAVIGAWGVGVTTTFEHPTPQAALPSATPVPVLATVVTQYPGQALLTQTQLCAKVVPRFNSVIVDSRTGEVVADIRC